MRVVVAGYGSVGRRHARLLCELGHDVALYRRRVTGDEPFPAFATLDDAQAWLPEAVVVATPTSDHLHTLRQAVDRGMHAYVEKPLAATSVGVAEVLDRAERQGLVVAVGYNLRFHPAFEAIERAVSEGSIGRLLSVRVEAGKYLPDWHPDGDYRQSYAARHELGGGALLTLSHELDLVRWIAGEIVDVRGTTAHVSALDLDVDDVAEVVCQHQAGAISSVHVDFLDRSFNRRSRWIGERATLAWTWGGAVELQPGVTVLWDDQAFDVDRTYAAALADFVHAVEERRVPRCDGAAGARVVELCEAIP